MTHTMLRYAIFDYFGVRYLAEVSEPFSAKFTGFLKLHVISIAKFMILDKQLVGSLETFGDDSITPPVNIECTRCLKVFETDTRLDEDSAELLLHIFE